MSSPVFTTHEGQLVGPQPWVAEPNTGYDYCQGIVIPASLLNESRARAAPKTIYCDFNPPLDHTGRPVWRNLRTTGRRNLTKTIEQGKRAWEEAANPENEGTQPVAKKARPAPPTETAHPAARLYTRPPLPKRPYEAESFGTLGPVPRHVTSFLNAAATAIGIRSPASMHRSAGASAAAAKTPAASKRRAMPSHSPAQRGLASQKGNPAKPSPVSQGAVAKKAPGQGRPVPATSPTNSCPPPVTPKQVLKKSRAASPITTFQDSPAKDNPGHGKLCPATLPTPSSPSSATSERTFKISRRSSPRSPFQDDVVQGDKPDVVASHHDSAMGILDEGLPTAGSSCADTATSPPTASAVPAAGQRLQQKPELTQSTGNGSASCPPSTVGILEPGLPAAGTCCTNTATSSATAPAEAAASQSLHEDPEEIDCDEDEDAASWEAMQDSLSGDTGAAAPAACPASPPRAADPRLCTRGLWDACTYAMASCSERRSPIGKRSSQASRHASARGQEMTHLTERCFSPGLPALIAQWLTAPV